MENKLGYNFLDYNPSEDTPLPVIDGYLYEKRGALTWLGDYRKHARLIDMEYDNLSQAYPNLLTHIETLSAYSVNSDHFKKPTESQRCFEFGAVIGLLSVENSLPDNRRMIDISPQYMEAFSMQDGFEMEHWLNNSSSYVKYQYMNMIKFLTDNYYQTTDAQGFRLILDTACNAYIASSHFLACYEREKELAWMTRDDESFQGWLTYRYGRD